MRDVDNNLSAVIVEPTSTGSCGDDSNQNILIDNLPDAADTKCYSHLRDKLWEVIDKEIGMSQCDIYRYIISTCV